MNFSELVTFSGLVQFSPDSRYFAVVKQTSLTIYSVSDIETFANWPLADQPSNLEWSRDSRYLLTTHQKRGIVQIYSLADQSWNGRITLTPCGVANAFWSPDSLQILAITDFELRLSAWNLTDMSVYHIRNPKFNDKGYSFSSDGKFMVLAERNEGKDYIGIYYTGDWQVVNHFATDTFDLEDAKWAPDDTAIIVWDSCLVYSLIIYSPLGTPLARHRPYDNGLGIKTLSISPNGTFIAAGSYDQSARVFTKISWRFLSELPHQSQITEGTDIHVYKEEEYNESLGFGGAEERLTSKYGMQDIPVKLPTLKVPKDKPNPPTGVSLCEWSNNTNYLATRNDSQPNVLWLWNMATLSLNVLLIQQQPIKNAEWNSKTLHLAFCTGTPRLFLWSLEGASVCDVPLENKDFKVQKIVWSPDGQSMILMDKNKLLIAYPQFEVLEAGNEEYF